MILIERHFENRGIIRALFAGWETKIRETKEDYANNPRFDSFCPRSESELKSFRCEAGLGRLHDAATTPA